MILVDPEHEPKDHKNLEAHCFRGIFGRKEAEKSYGINISKSDNNDNLTSNYVLHLLHCVTSKVY